MKVIPDLDSIIIEGTSTGTKLRPQIIKSFEKIMTNHGIELQKLKETLQKFVLFRKIKRDT